jgi:hypothetical protein
MQPAVSAQEPVPALAATEVPAVLGEPPVPRAALEASGIEMAAFSLIESGLRFIETIASDHASGSSGTTPASRLDQPLDGLFTRDARTNRPVLSIPLPESVTRERLSGAIFALLNAFGGAAKVPGGLSK